MSNTPAFSRFAVKGLRGVVDIDANIENNTLILVGENGSGKTTFLRMLFYFLSGRWHNLSQFKFGIIVAVVAGKEYTIRPQDIEGTASQLDDRMLSRLPPSARRRILEFIDAGMDDEAAGLYNEMAPRYNLPRRAVAQRELSLAISGLNDEVLKTLDAQILYLPTFRRIERELSSIVMGLDPDEVRRAPRSLRQSEDGTDYLELVEFGMRDVTHAIDKALDTIRTFQLNGTTRLSLSYLGDVVSRAYMSTDRSSIANTPDATIDAVLSRIDATILSSYDKSHLREIIVSAKMSNELGSEHERIIFHYFTKLIDFQKELQAKEENIKSFCDLCSEYITDKKFVYESGRAGFSIVSVKQERIISLADLSSGEKQIVSLFSHLLLSGRTKFFVLIDEPELSLSVPWQRRFLVDIRDASFCAGLIAATHSPFIYDNKLRPSTHALGEFLLQSDPAGSDEYA